MLDEAVGQLGDVYEAVLVHAHIDEGAKVDDVAYRALELHAGLQVVNRKCRAAKDHLGRVVARVAAGFLELVDDVDERQGAAVQVACQRRDAAQAALDIGYAATAEFAGGNAGALQDGRGHLVAFGVDARRVERVLATADAQEARGVEICLGPQLGDLLELAAIGKGAVFLAESHDILGHARRDARYVSQQARARGVYIDAHTVDDVLHHVAQRARELGLVKVVLVLAHADGLGRNLDELCQRVLQATTQAHGAAHGDVQVGVFLTGELGGGVHRRAGFVDDGVAKAGRLLGDELRDDFLGLAAGGAVADDDGVDAVLLDEAGELALGAGDVVARLGWVDHAVVE